MAHSQQTPPYDASLPPSPKMEGVIKYSRGKEFSAAGARAQQTPDSVQLADDGVDVRCPVTRVADVLK